MAKDIARFKNCVVDIVRDNVTYNNCYRVAVGFGPEADAGAFEALNYAVNQFSQAGNENAEVSLEINQRFPTSQFDTDESKLSAKFNANVRFSQYTLDHFLQQLSQQTYRQDNKNAITLLQFFLSGTVDLKFNSIESLLDSKFVELPEGIPRINGFVSLRQFLIPQIGGLYGEVTRDPQIGQLFDGIYSKLYDSITGFHELKIGFRGYVLSVKFDNFNLFQGFLPTLEDIKVYAVEDTNPMDY